MSRQDIIGEVSAENVRRHVEHITTAIPSRLAGSPNARRMAEYSLQALFEAGAEARVLELPGLVSLPKKGELRIVAPREISIEVNTLVPYGASLLTWCVESRPPLNPIKS
jgi:hypothetical protein